MTTFRSHALLVVLSLAALALGILALFPPAAHADPGIVRVTQNATATWPCGHLANWSNPCPLQTALANAVSGDEIWVASGTYTPGTNRAETFALKDGVGVYGGFAGTESTRDGRNVTANETILSGDIGTAGDTSDNSYHVITGSGTNSTAVLDGFTVTGANANGTNPDDRGGGMLNLSGSPTLANIIFTGNNAAFGAGVYDDTSSPSLTNVTFSGNSAHDGGGMYDNNSSPSLMNVTFSGNSADPTNGYGGGMYDNYGSPSLMNVTFSGNSALRGGGMCNNYGDGPSLTNVTFSNNSAIGQGGGMFIMSHSPHIRNAIFWGNTGPIGPQISYLVLFELDIDHSVVQGGCPSGVPCPPVISADPRLGALGDWGGSTQTIPLHSGSSAINAGDDDTCPSTDQRGKPRIEFCDAGAFEFQGYALAGTGGDHQTTLVGSSFGLPLQVTLTEAETSLPVPGTTIAFTAPLNGASAAWNGSLTRTATTDSNGAASVDPPTANSAAGSYGIVAASSRLVGGMAQTTLVLTNAQANTTVVLTSSANPSVRGQPVTFGAVVSGASPTGTVSFTDGGASLGCDAVALSGGGAACTVSSPALGAHGISAEYSGDTLNQASRSGLDQVVVKADTTTSISSSQNPVLVGHAVVFTVTVSAVLPGSGTPTGSVMLYETASPSGASWGARRTLAGHSLVNGVAIFTVSSLAAGTHNMLALYSGDANYNASTSSIYAHLVDVVNSFLPFVAR